MISATVNFYRLKFFKDKEEIANIKTTSIEVPKENSSFVIDDTTYNIKEVIPHFISDTNKYPYMQYIIKIEEIEDDKEN